MTMITTMGRGAEHRRACPIPMLQVQSILREGLLPGVRRLTLADAGGGVYETVQAMEPRTGWRACTPAERTAPVLLHGAAVAYVRAEGPASAAGALARAARLGAASLAHAWGTADEIDSLAGEVVHAYEELHLLYALGTSLGGDLTVAQVSDLILEKTLDTLSAAWAEVTLTGEGPIYVRPGRHAEPQSIGRNGGEHRLTTTLRAGGETIGNITLVRPGDAPPFSSADGKLLDAVGTLAGNAMCNAQLYEELRRQADTDVLTGVCNHRALQQRLDAALAAAAAQGRTLGVMMIDIDDFKLFNDTYGHLVGDRILRLAAETLSAACREGDSVGRYGGDEFVILLPGSDRAGMAQVARRILDAMAEQGVAVNGHTTLPLALSIGCAVFPDDAVLKHDLLSFADAALYETKRRGGNGLSYAQKDSEAEPDELTTSTTFGALQGLVNAVDAKDRYTRLHSDAVTDGALLLAQRLGLSEEVCSALRIAGLLHDVGKIGIPDRILRKPGPLNREEYAVMQQHVALSELIIKEVPHLVDVLSAVAAHHERYDGHGYPRGLRGEEIPLLGRIMALADACSAMLLTRPYRKGLPWPDVVVELRRGAGTQFDPDLVEPFIAAMEESGLVSEPRTTPVLKHYA